MNSAHKIFLGILTADGFVCLNCLLLNRLFGAVEPIGGFHVRNQLVWPSVFTQRIIVNGEPLEGLAAVNIWWRGGVFKWKASIEVSPAKIQKIINSLKIIQIHHNKVIHHKFATSPPSCWRVERITVTVDASYFSHLFISKQTVWLIWGLRLLITIDSIEPTKRIEKCR